MGLFDIFSKIAKITGAGSGSQVNPGDFSTAGNGNSTNGPSAVSNPKESSSIGSLARSLDSHSGHSDIALDVASIMHEITQKPSQDSPANGKSGFDRLAGDVQAPRVHQHLAERSIKGALGA